MIPWSFYYYFKLKKSTKTKIDNQPQEERVEKYKLINCFFGLHDGFLIEHSVVKSSLSITMSVPGFHEHMDAKNMFFWISDIFLCIGRAVVLLNSEAWLNSKSARFQMAV